MYGLQLLSEISYLAVGHLNNTKYWVYLLLGILSGNDVYGNENVTCRWHFRNIDYFKKIACWTHSILVATHAKNGLVEASLKQIWGIKNIGL